MSHKVIALSSSSSSSSSDDDDEEGAMDLDFDPSLLPLAVLNMAMDDEDPMFEKHANRLYAMRIHTFLQLFPAGDCPLVLSDLLLALLRADNATDRATILHDWSAPRSPERIGDPYPFSRLDCFTFAQFFQGLISQRWRRNEDLFGIKSPLTSSMEVYREDVARLLEHRTWVGDSIVDAFGTLLARDLDHIAYLPSFVWKDRPPYSKTRLYLTERNVANLKASKFLLSAVHNAAHWTFLLFKHEKGSCTFHNSFSATWSEFSTRAQKEHLKFVLQCLAALFPAYKDDAVVKRARHFPRQGDGTSCALYVTHGMHCLASANYVHQFGEESWDYKAEFLRLELCHCLIQARVRSLRTTVSSSSAGSSLDPLSDDVLDEYVDFRQMTCTQCHKVGRCFVCIPWNAAFCNVECQQAYAVANKLYYFDD